MESKKILLIGGGGHCRSVLDSLLKLGIYDRIGVIDQCTDVPPVMGIPVVGTDADLPALYEQGWTSAFITLGSVGNSARRKAIFERLRNLGYSLPCIIDTTASVSEYAHLGEGVFVGKHAVVNAGSTVGNGAIINTGAIVEHDCDIGPFVHISPGCTLCGGVKVGEDAHVGAGSVVRQQIEIGKSTLVGIGSTVVKSLPDRVEAFGNPCRVVKSR